MIHDDKTSDCFKHLGGKSTLDCDVHVEESSNTLVTQRALSKCFLRTGLVLAVSKCLAPQQFCFTPKNNTCKSPYFSDRTRGAICAARRLLYFITDPSANFCYLYNTEPVAASHGFFLPPVRAQHSAHRFKSVVVGLLKMNFPSTLSSSARSGWIRVSGRWPSRLRQAAERQMTSS